MKSLHPTTFLEIEKWARSHREPKEWALKRFITFAALDAIYSVPGFSNSLILRGSAAITFRCPGFRPANDLDFMYTEIKGTVSPSELEPICEQIRRSLEIGLVNFFPDYSDGWEERLKRDIHIHVLPLEYQPFYTQMALPKPSEKLLNVWELECLVMDKIIGLLAQPRAKLARPRDLLDLAAIIWRRESGINKLRLIEYYRQKTAKVDQDIILAQKSFTEEVRTMSRMGYDEFARSVQSDIPFDRAWKILLEFVGDLESLELSQQE